MPIANLCTITFVVAASNHGSMQMNRHDDRLTKRGGYGVGFQLLNNSAFDPGEIDFRTVTTQYA